MEILEDSILGPPRPGTNMRGVGHGTMGLKCVALYYMRGLGVGPWV